MTEVVRDGLAVALAVVNGIVVFHLVIALTSDWVERAKR